MYTDHLQPLARAAIELLRLARLTMLCKRPPLHICLSFTELTVTLGTPLDSKAVTFGPGPSRR